jgi:hypothetical protein
MYVGYFCYFQISAQSIQSPKWVNSQSNLVTLVLKEAAEQGDQILIFKSLKNLFEPPPTFSYYYFSSTTLLAGMELIVSYRGLECSLHFSSVVRKKFAQMLPCQIEYTTFNKLPPFFGYLGILLTKQ